MKRPYPFKIIAIFVFCLFFILIAFLYWILGTSSGLRASMTIANKISPYYFKAHGIKGSILGGLYLEEIFIRGDDFKINSKKIDIKWRPLRLFERVLKIDEIGIGNLSVSLKKSKDDNKNKGEILPKKIDIPIDIYLKRLHVSKFVIKEDDKKIFYGRKFSTSFVIKKNIFYLNSLDLTALNRFRLLDAKGIFNTKKLNLSLSLKVRSSLKDKVFLCRGSLFGNTQKINIKSTVFELNDKKELKKLISVMGDIYPQEGIAFRTRWVLTKFRPEIFKEGIPGIFSGNIDLFGRIKKKPFVKIHIKNAISKVYGKELSINGISRIEKENISIDSLSLKAKDSSVFINGTLDKKGSNLNIDFKSKNISDLFDIKDTELFIKARLSSRDLTSIKSKIKIDATDKKRGISLDTKLEGTINNFKEFRGEFESLNIKTRNFGNFFERNRASLFISKEKATIRRLILENDRYSSIFSLDGEIGKNKKSFDILLRSIPLSLFSKFLSKKDIKFSGLLNGRINFFQTYSEYPKGTVNFSTKNAQIFLPYSQKLHKFPAHLRFNAKFKKGKFSGNGNGKIKGLGEIFCNIYFNFLPENPFYIDQKTLRADIQFKGNDFSLLPEIFNEISNPRGNIDFKLRVEGPLDKPKFLTKGFIKEFRFEIPKLGISPSINRLEINGDNNDTKLFSKIYSGKGLINLYGHISLSNEPRIKIQIEGKDFRAFDLHEIVTDISPQVEITLNKNQLKTVGTLLIPFTNIIIKKLPKGITAPSSDIIIVDSKAHKKDYKKSKLEISTDLKVVLGDKIFFDGFGLSGKLEGSISIHSKTDEVVLASGTLYLKDGSYSAFGTKLDITRGKLIYSETPIDNPLIDIEALREIGEKTVGLKITGRLKSPELTLFSEPEMPDSEILAFLIGKSDSDHQKTDVIASGSNILLSKIRKAIGLKELELETTRDTKNLSLILGTYITPRLYIKFINDIEDKMTKIKIRYNLTKHIEIQTESGEDPSVDIFYKITK